MSTAADALQLAGSLGPWLAGAAVALGLLLRFGRSWAVATRASAKAQGERLGELERKAELERTRRLQLEDVLLDLGVDIPWWPPDGPSRPHPRSFPPRQRDEEPDEDYPRTDYVPTSPPVPPLPDLPAFARHRR